MGTAWPKNNNLERLFLISVLFDDGHVAFWGQAYWR